VRYFLCPVVAAVAAEQDQAVAAVLAAEGFC
jgi:hypothetical protein